MNIEPIPARAAASEEPEVAATNLLSGRQPLDAVALRLKMGEWEMGELWVSEQTGSTNDDLAARAKAAPPANLSVETTEHQMAGHGRLGRGWQAPPRSSLASSICFRPSAGFDQTGLAWLSMLCAAAMVQTLRQDAGIEAGLKWPNDVVAGGKKVCGVLAQLVLTAQGPVVVVGAGLNVSNTAEELPVKTASSLALLEATTLDRTLLLGGYLRRVAHLYRRFERAGGDVNAGAGAGCGDGANAGAADDAVNLRQVVRSLMVTIGHDVDAHLPDGTVLRGVATDLDSSGSLALKLADGTVRNVLAGDIHHLRRSDGSYA